MTVGIDMFWRLRVWWWSAADLDPDGFSFGAQRNCPDVVLFGRFKSSLRLRAGLRRVVPRCESQGSRKKLDLKTMVERLKVRNDALNIDVAETCCLLLLLGSALGANQRALQPNTEDPENSG